MSYAIELYFDTHTETAVRQIWQAIAGTGCKSAMLEAGYRPHISLAVYDRDTLDLASLQQTLLAYARALPPFALTFATVSSFPTSEGVIFLGVTVTQKLLAMHAHFHRVFARYAEACRPYYKVGHWVPHCTLSFGVSAGESAQILPLCWRTPFPLSGQVQEIGLANVSPARCEFLFVTALGPQEG